MSKISLYIRYLLIVIALAGVIDALYLTIEHYSGTIPPCSIYWWASDCGRVLRSSYATPFGIPLALIGLIHYCVEFLLAAYSATSKKRVPAGLLTGLTWIGMGASAYFVFLMLVVIQGICLYCMGSAIISTLLFLLTPLAYPRGRFQVVVTVGSFVYQKFLKPIFFQIDPEKIHVSMVQAGEMASQIPGIVPVTSHFFRIKNPTLSQNLHGIQFELPVGLAAGFDYEARLTQSLSMLGFGFQSVGTITNSAYEGNPRPMLGRLPNSKSLMVNKGYKNPGAAVVAEKLSQLSFPIPVGISVGRTNSRTKSLTQKQSVTDICQAFDTFEKSTIAHSYYELNISCPNLYGDVSFYPPKNLAELLHEVDRLKLTKPVFVKMPIEKSLAETKEMLSVISKHSPVGVIFGNLQKDRKHSSLDRAEVAKFSVGNFSGKPTYEDSNARIELCYKHFGKRFMIIGCGGVFNGKDAYEKIRRGASLVQLITGMIYQGPQLISEINLELLELLARDGFTNIGDAVGSKARRS